MPGSEGESKLKSDTLPLVGIVGGLGPHAHIGLEKGILEAAARRIKRGENRPAREQELPQWILVSFPWTPDRTEAIVNGAESPVPALQDALERLGRAGANYAVVACNTAHHFLKELPKDNMPETVSMIRLCAEQVREQVGDAPVGLLATTGTIRARVYHEEIANLWTPCDLPGESIGSSPSQDRVMTAIYGPLGQDGVRRGGIKGRARMDPIRQELREVGQAMVRSLGVKAFIAGCTELPLAMDADLTEVKRLWRRVGGVPVIDPIRVVAEYVVRRFSSYD